MSLSNTNGSSGHNGSASPEPIILGDYELKRTIGSGGMGEVWEAFHVRMQKQFAVKVIRPDERHSTAAIARFNRETVAISQIDDANVVAARNAGEIDGRLFLAMDYLKGFNLKSILRQNGNLSNDKAVEVVRQTALGLQAIADAGLVHRDIKPSNLFLCEDGTVKILDLGLAAMAERPPDETQLTETHSVPGTVDYMAPERTDPSIDDSITADVYSLGCVFYELVVGRPPFENRKEGGSVKVLVAHMNEPVPKLPDDIPPRLRSLYRSMMEKDPAKRPSQPAAIAAELAEFLTDTRPDLSSLLLPPRERETEQLHTADLAKHTGSKTMRSRMFQAFANHKTTNLLLGLLILMTAAAMVLWWPKGLQVPSPRDDGAEMELRGFVRPIQGESARRLDDVPERGVWVDLFAKPPRRILWITRSEDDLDLLRMKQGKVKSMRVCASSTTSMHDLGTIHAEDYVIRLEVVSKSREGECGIVLGRAVGKSGKSWRYQLVTVRRTIDGMAEVAVSEIDREIPRGMRTLLSRGTGRVRFPKKSVVLEVEVRGDLIREIRLQEPRGNARPIPLKTGPKNQQDYFPRALNPDGAIGLFTQGSDAVFLRSELLLGHRKVDN